MASPDQYQKEITIGDVAASEEGRAPSALDPEKVDTKQGLVARFEKHMLKDIATSHADLLLLVCCFVSGLLDSVVFNGMPCQGNQNRQ